jgi:type I restriction enzyme S subunit
MQKVKLKDIALISAGQAAPKEFSNYGIPFIRAGHLEDLLSGISLNELPKITEEIAQKNRLKKLPKGSILFAKSGMSAKKNRIYISKEDSYFVSHLAAILPSDNFNTNFLARYLNWFNPTNLILDEAYPSIRLEDINNLEIPLPNLPTQQKISNILDKADELRQYNKQLIEKYEALTQSLFLDMFGDIDSNKKFPIGTIENFIEIVRDGPHISPKYSESGIPILSTRNIRPFLLINEEIKYVSIETYTEMTKRFKPQKGDVLLTKGGTTGFAKIVDWDWDFCIWVHLAALRVKKDVSPKYIESALNSYYGYNQSQEHTRGIANKDLGLKRMIKIKIPIPSFDLQNQFAERVAVIETQKLQAQEALAKSEVLFQGLLQQAFNGELNTPPYGYPS